MSISTLSFSLHGSPTVPCQGVQVTCGLGTDLPGVGMYLLMYVLMPHEAKAKASLLYLTYIPLQYLACLASNPQPPALRPPQTNFGGVYAKLSTSCIHLLSYSSAFALFPHPSHRIIHQSFLCASFFLSLGPVSADCRQLLTTRSSNFLYQTDLFRRAVN